MCCASLLRNEIQGEQVNLFHDENGEAERDCDGDYQCEVLEFDLPSWNVGLQGRGPEEMRPEFVGFVDDQVRVLEKRLFENHLMHISNELLISRLVNVRVEAVEVELRVGVQVACLVSGAAWLPVPEIYRVRVVQLNPEMVLRKYS